MTAGSAVTREEVEVLAGRICAAAGLAARSECRMLELLGEFEDLNPIGWFQGMKSVAHWLSWCCSMKPSTAREHVRVAKAMRRMPSVTAAFRDGKLSYSKVREVTRVVDVLDEERLCAMALTATASQLARMISGYRTAAGSRIRQERERSLSWTERPDGMIDFRIRLPKEEAALLIAAITAAKDQFGSPPSAACPDRTVDEAVGTPLSHSGGLSDRTAGGDIRRGRAAGAVGGPVPGADPDGLAARRAQLRRRAALEKPADPTPTYGYPDAILDVARGFLQTAPVDRSGEDRTLVVVHVAAAQLTTNSAGLAAQGRDVPAGTPAGGPTFPDPAAAPVAESGREAGDTPWAPAGEDNHDTYCEAAPTSDVPAVRGGSSDVPAGAGADSDAPTEAGAADSDAPAEAGGADSDAPAGAGAGPRVPAEAGASSDVPAAGGGSSDVPAGAGADSRVPVGVRAGSGARESAARNGAGGSAGALSASQLSAEATRADRPRRADPTCHIQGVSGIEPETARRLACDADVIAAVVGLDGEVLALGRARRLVSRAQRRALMIRDAGICQFPGCHQTRHLEAHHILAWADGGATDLSNLILICRFHHTAVHEGRMKIIPAAEPSAGRRWEFVMPDGKPHQDWYDAEGLAHLLARQAPEHDARFDTVVDDVDGFGHPDARRIRPGWCGEPFDLHECVQALFRMQLPGDEPEDWEAA